MINKKIFVSILLLFLSVNIFAQTNTPPPPQADPGTPPGAPIDDWIYLFLISALFIGVYKLTKMVKLSNHKDA